MNILQLKDNFYWLGMQDPDLRVFDIIMETKYGTSYNSYALKTNEGIILFETVKAKYIDAYIEKINTIGSIEEVKYIVCNHTEPDHSGSIEKLVSLNPSIVVISSMIANMYLKEIINNTFAAKLVKDNEVFTFGGYTLRFINTPNLHWPDSMYTYIEENEVLVTCDSFGAHYAHEDVLLSTVKDRTAYQEGFDYYSTMIMGPFKQYVLKAMDKIKDLPIALIAPGHGPVIDIDIEAMIQQYITFSLPKCKDTHSVVIPYVSAYGYTKQMAEIIRDVCHEHDLDCHIYDLVEADTQSVVQKMQEADAILYGCPTLLNDALPPIYEVMNQILAAYHGKKVVSAFGSYGWSGEAVTNMMTRLTQQKMHIVDEGLRIKFKPSATQINEVKQYATHFIQQLKNIPA